MVRLERALHIAASLQMELKNIITQTIRINTNSKSLIIPTCTQTLFICPDRPNRHTRSPRSSNRQFPPTVRIWRYMCMIPYLTHQRHSKDGLDGGYNPLASQRAPPLPPRDVAHHHPRHHRQGCQKRPVSEGSNEGGERNGALPHLRDVEADQDEPRPCRAAQARRHLRLKYGGKRALCER